MDAIPCWFFHFVGSILLNSMDPPPPPPPVTEGEEGHKVVRGRWAPPPAEGKGSRKRQG